MLDGWMLDVGWLEKAELKPTQPSLARAWLSLAIELEVTEGKRGSSYFALKKLGFRPGELSRPDFQTPDHVKNKFTPEKSAELLADYFSAVSQEYAPLDTGKLLRTIQSYLSVEDDAAPILSVTDVYRKLMRAKKPNSSVPRDLPKKVVQRYAAKLAVPVSVIYNKITTTSVYPQQWKLEQKCSPQSPKTT